jgi:hypothetical protein
MRTLQITATVTPDHELKVQLPPEIPVGDYGKRMKDQG